MTMPVRHDGGKPRVDLLPIDVIDTLRQNWVPDVESSRIMIDAWFCRRGELDLLTNGTAGMLCALWDHHELGVEGALAEVMAAGLGKYPAHNWRFPPGLSYSRVYGAAVRHRIRHTLAGEAWPVMVDEESGCPHLWHEVWGYLALCAYNEYSIGIDDRPPHTYAQV